MRKVLFVTGAIALCCLISQTSASAGTFAFGGAADRSGDLQGPLQIVDDFTVTSPSGINVSQLGIFIDGFDGFSGLSENHVVSLYSRANTSTPLTSVSIGGSFATTSGPFAYNNPQNSNSISPQLTGGWGYVNIAPLFLPNGFTGSIVAYRMSDGQNYTDDYGDAVQFNNGGGLISFSKSYHVASTGTTGDTTLGQSNEIMGAGSFTFAAAPVTTPEPATLGALCVASTLALRRRRTR